MKGQYGKSYLVVSDKVKKSRCTYSRYDSSVPTVTGPSRLATFNTQMCNISKQFTKEEIKSMENFYKFADKEWYHDEMNRAKHYMEVQIHGELIFARDISRIMIDPALKGNKVFMTLLDQYFEIIGTKVPYEFI